MNEIDTLKAKNYQLKMALCQYQKDQVPEQKTSYQELSDRCKSVLDFFEDGGWHSRAEIGIELGLEMNQITATMELLKRHKYYFESKPMGGRDNTGFMLYKLSDTKPQPETKRDMHVPNKINQRLIVEINRIRLMAVEKNDTDIEKLAVAALKSCGIGAEREEKPRKIKFL